MVAVLHRNRLIKSVYDHIEKPRASDALKAVERRLSRLMENPPKHTRIPVKTDTIGVAKINGMFCPFTAPNGGGQREYHGEFKTVIEAGLTRFLHEPIPKRTGSSSAKNLLRSREVFFLNNLTETGKCVKDIPAHIIKCKGMRYKKGLELNFNKIK